MTPEERAREVTMAFRQAGDKSTRNLMIMIAEAIREAVLEERQACMTAMYTGIDLEKIERVVSARSPRTRKSTLSHLEPSLV